MIIATSSSPHTHKGRARNANVLMAELLLATIPGLAAITWFFGWGTFVNVIWCSLLAITMEACVMKMRGRPILFYIKDMSALVTAVLLALAIPPYAPFWVSGIGILFAIVIAKHLYGGLGYNPFNPAMVGYVVLLLSFPVQMTQWVTPGPILPETAALPDLLQSISIIFGSTVNTGIDAITSATPLDILKQNKSLLLDQLYVEQAVFSEARLNTVGFEWVSIGFLLGGIYLIFRKVFTWHAPVGMLVALAILPLMFFDGGSSASKGSSWFHLMSGATMLGAFFIITDPVSGATSNLGRLLFGVGVGVLVFVIRSWGSYPDAIAFAVMLMNFAAPTIDYYTQPRTYGHKERNKVKIGEESE